MKKINNDLLYYLGFSYCFGIGPMKFSRLKKYFKSAKKAYLANHSELEKVLGFVLSKKFVEFRRKFNFNKESEILKKNAVTVLTVDSKDYPVSLKNISDPPICLYIKGNSALLNSVPGDFFFSIVGTRKPTSYGRQITYKFARELTEAGFIIVSGMAMGVDTIAHQATLDTGGKTIAVLGCGVNIIYPPSNWQLYKSIIKTGGSVISEFPPNQYVLKGLFISRNRIISGLSRGVLVSEGGKFSGALITAKFAGIQGKDVFAVPSPISSEMAPAPNLLIKQGAKMVTSTQDILDEFGINITPKKSKDIRKNLSDSEKLIFDILIKSPKSIDEIANETVKMIPEILNTISVLEINGIVEKNIEKKYQLRI